MKVDPLLALALVLLCVGCAVERRQRVPGIASVRIAEDGTVMVTDATEGNGAAMMLLDSQRKGVESVTLSVGDTFTLTDGRHVGTAYEFLGVRGARAVFKERKWHRTPEGPSEETLTEISVSGY